MSAAPSAQIGARARRNAIDCAPAIALAARRQARLRPEIDREGEGWQGVQFMAQSSILSPSERRFLDLQRVGHLATADRQSVPHVVPICFALIESTLYSSIDDKPKGKSSQPLKRLRNIRENPHVCVVVDRYREDWKRLAWVMLWGRAEILTQGSEHDHAQEALRNRYQQYRGMRISSYPVIALRVERAASWGNLSVR